MVGSMRRGKSGAAGTVFHQESNVIGDSGVMAGAQMKNMFLYHGAAYEIAEGNIQNKEQRPPNPILFKIDGDEQHEEKIKGRPKNTFPYEWKKSVEKIIVPLAVDPVEQGTVKTLQAFEQRNGTGL